VRRRPAGSLGPLRRPPGALLGADERAERMQVEDAIEALEREDADPRILALSERSRQLAAVLARLRALADEGILERSLDDVIASLAHMAVNRMLLRCANHDEVRLHDALARLSASLMARLRSATGSRPAPQGVDRAGAPR